MLEFECSLSLCSHHLYSSGVEMRFTKSYFVQAENFTKFRTLSGANHFSPHTDYPQNTVFNRLFSYFMKGHQTRRSISTLSVLPSPEMSPTLQKWVMSSSRPLLLQPEASCLSLILHCVQPMFLAPCVILKWVLGESVRRFGHSVQKMW